MKAAIKTARWLLVLAMSYGGAAAAADACKSPDEHCPSVAALLQLSLIHI